MSCGNLLKHIIMEIYKTIDTIQQKFFNIIAAIFTFDIPKDIIKNIFLYTN